MILLMMFVQKSTDIKPLMPLILQGFLTLLTTNPWLTEGR